MTANSHVHDHAHGDDNFGDGDHAHHGHGTHHHGGSSGALGWSLLIVLAFGSIEIAVGIVSGSLALASDGVHMLTDSLALAIAWGAQWLARRRSGPTLSFGWARIEPLAAFVNALLYAGVIVFIVYEAIVRLFDPPPIDSSLALPVAVIGLLINAAIWKILHGGGHELNTRAALLHVIGDFAGSLIAIVAIALARYTGWLVVDPLLSLAISALLLVSTARLLRDSGRVLMNGVPIGLVSADVGEVLQQVEGVTGFHDLHVWSMGEREVALAAHVHVRDMAEWPRVLQDTQAVLQARFGIRHSTLQPESEDEACALQAASCGAEGRVSPV